MAAMTCIVGISDGRNVWIGGDSAGSSGWDQRIRSDAKVFTNGPMVFGFTTSFRMGQLLRYKLAVPRQFDDGDMAYLCGPFIDAVRSTLKDGGFATLKDGAEAGGSFLVGYRGALYGVHSDYQIASYADNYAAVGCGDSYALGSLHGSTGTPTKRINAALDAAAYFSAGVAGPYTILSGAEQ
jgi:ATP-dependent protease HslVU (ClpYQ) peptidase subunit